MQNHDAVEILLVEDNPRDVELALRALRKRKLANHVHVAKDGEEALEFIFATGAYAHRNAENDPKVVLLDLKLPKVGGLEVLRRIKADDRTKRRGDGWCAAADLHPLTVAHSLCRN